MAGYYVTTAVSFPPVGALYSRTEEAMFVYHLRQLASNKLIAAVARLAVAETIDHSLQASVGRFFVCSLTRVWLQAVRFLPGLAGTWEFYFFLGRGWTPRAPSLKHVHRRAAAHNYRYKIGIPRVLSHYSFSCLFTDTRWVTIRI